MGIGYYKGMQTTDIASARIEGESQVQLFNPKSHPGFVYRCFLAGLQTDQIAAILGITVDKLSHWLATYPELIRAQRMAMEADAEVVQSLYDAATGYMDPKTGRRKGFSVYAQIFWLKNRLGWRDKDLRSPKNDSPDDMSPDALKRAAKEMLRLRDNIQNRELIDVTPGDPDVF